MNSINPDGEALRDLEFPIDVRISFPDDIDVGTVGSRMESGGLQKVFASMFGFIEGTIPDPEVLAYVQKFGGRIALREIVD